MIAQCAKQEARDFSSLHQTKLSPKTTNGSFSINTRFGGARNKKKTLSWIQYLLGGMKEYFVINKRY